MVFCLDSPVCGPIWVRAQVLVEIEVALSVRESFVNVLQWWKNTYNDHDYGPEAGVQELQIRVE